MIFESSKLPSSLEIRLALVEHATLVREGLAALFANTPDIRCTVLAADHATAVQLSEAAPPDVALLDVSIADSMGKSGVRLWQEKLPDVRLILFDEFIRDMHVRQVLRMHLAGYVTKRDSFADVLYVIRASMRGEQAFPTAIRHRLKITSRGWEIQVPHGSPGLHSLTPRETEVLTYLAQGLTGKQCSELLKISPSTVDNHKARIMRKLEVHKTVELTRLALREGLMPR